MCLLCPQPHVSTREWSKASLRLECRPEGGGAAIVVEAPFPIGPKDAWELLAHPGNADIYSNVDRCTYRRVWIDDHCGRQVVEVENESGEFSRARGRTGRIARESTGQGLGGRAASPEGACAGLYPPDSPK